jgi:hypothetical protein
MIWIIVMSIDMASIMRGTEPGLSRNWKMASQEATMIIMMMTIIRMEIPVVIEFVF